ncbi:MAG: ChbG/HpnK family deacetylase [Acidobacteriota bacterium]
MKRLIVNADDYGLCKGVVDGIIEAHRRGIVTSASVMAGGQAFDYGVEQSRSNPKLSLGVHLTLVEERPVSANPGTLAQSDGWLPHSYPALLTGILMRRIRLGDVERELRAQIEKCFSAGLRPAHLDSHQHVHTLPAILRIVLQLAREYGISRVRLPRDSPGRHGAMRGDRFWQKAALCWLARYDAGRFQDKEISFRYPITGLFESGALTESRLLGILDQIPEGTTELVCHPGWEDPACKEDYAHWGYHWEIEEQALTSAAVRARIHARGIELVTA